MDNVIPGRFLIVTYLCAAVMLGLIIDHTRTGWGEGSTHPGDLRQNRRSGVSRPDGARAGSWAAIGVALVALVPIFAYYADSLPFTTQSVVLPTWFRTVGPHLDRGQCVLTFPVPLGSSSERSDLAGRRWHVLLPGGWWWPGVDRLTSRQGGEAGQVYIGDVSISTGGEHQLGRRVAVIPSGTQRMGRHDDRHPRHPVGCPPTRRLHAVRSAVILMTAATGSLPFRQADAWVWTDVENSPPSRLLSAASYADCNRGPQEGTVASIQRSAACVLAAPLPPR